MESLPNEIVQYILSHLYNSRDVSSCTCVSKQWKELVQYIKNLFFPRNAFENHLCGESPETIIWKMISSMVGLEKLVVYCPFSTESLFSWLTLVAQSLKHLELRMDNLDEDHDCLESPSKMDCISLTNNLESLKLWGVSMTKCPMWNAFQKLRNLEIVGARLEDSALSDALCLCPNLTHFSLVRCEGLSIVSIELPYLQQCKLTLSGRGCCSLSLSSPRLEILEVEGCSWIRVPKTTCLKSLSIANNAGRVYMVDFDKLPALEFLEIRGVQWSWDAISQILRLATEVKHLYMKVEFTGDFEILLPFPEIDFADFFNNHPKLRKFDIHGAMFAALSQKHSLRNVGSKFGISSLEEMVISVRSPLNAEQKMSTIESLLKYGKNLKTMVIRVAKMKSNHSSADEFFEEVRRFAYINRKIVKIE